VLRFLVNLNLATIKKDNNNQLDDVRRSWSLLWFYDDPRGGEVTEAGETFPKSSDVHGSSAQARIVDVFDPWLSNLDPIDTHIHVRILCTYMYMYVGYVMFLGTLDHGKQASVVNPKGRWYLGRLLPTLHICSFAPI
jgi:hypothetical protein